MRRKDREVCDMNAIKEILDICKTANIAMVDEGKPYIVPLNYGYEVTDQYLVLYFHCAKEGRKLDILKKNNPVCFSIFSEGEPLYAETPCDSGYFYASVIGNGKAEFVETSPDKERVLEIITAHQTGRKYTFTQEQAATVCVFKVVSTDFTGKRKTKVTR